MGRIDYKSPQPHPDVEQHQTIGLMSTQRVGTLPTPNTKHILKEKTVENEGNNYEGGERCGNGGAGKGKDDGKK